MIFRDGRGRQRGLANSWAGGRAVECSGLENRRAGNGTVGSNPTLPVSSSSRENQRICERISQPDPTSRRPRPPRRLRRPHIATTRFGVIGAVSFVHLLNDMMQSVIVTIYPLLKDEFALSFVQIGLITLTFQLTASLLQPVVGMVTDKHPLPYSLPVGMCFTLSGLLLLSVAPSYADPAAVGGADRLRLGGVPPGILARRAHGIGRTLRACPVAVPDWRQHRPGARTAVRRGDHPAARACRARAGSRSRRCCRS